MSEVLTPQEVEELTKRVKPAWQRRQLDHLRIEYRVRSDGSLLVLWSNVRGPHTPQPRREPQLRLDT